MSEHQKTLDQLVKELNSVVYHPQFGVTAPIINICELIDTSINLLQKIIEVTKHFPFAGTVGVDNIIQPSVDVLHATRKVLHHSS